jgi:DNA-binding NarL/FixJ family response regulator
MEILSREQDSLPMATKTILIWGQDDILSLSMELFLSSQDGWQVICVPSEHDFEELIQTVDLVNPDVVIVRQDGLASTSSLAEILLQGHSGMKVIAISLDDNQMEVYCKKKILVKSSADLISEVEAKPVRKTGRRNFKGETNVNKNI